MSYECVVFYLKQEIVLQMFDNGCYVYDQLY